MFKGVPYSNKILKRREEQRIQVIHKQNLKNIRPLTTNLQIPLETIHNPYVNNKKKDMLQQHRFTQIERENRMLLEKINSIMIKKPTFKVEKIKRHNSIHTEKQRMNKSLNQNFRRKQLQGIQVENAKLLKRIMDKKSDYEAKKLKEEWKKQKTVIKNIANYPFIIRDKIYKGRRKSTTSHSFHQGGFTSNIPENNLLSSPIQLVRIRNLDGSNFLITVNYDGEKLQILGDNKSTKEIKVIEIPKDEAFEFIHFQCEGKIEQIFDCLRYNPDEKTLYLAGKGVDIEQQEMDRNNEQEMQRQQLATNGEEKGLKKRQMSQIREIQESELYTQQYRKTQVNLNVENNQQSDDKEDNKIQQQEENVENAKQQGAKETTIKEKTIAEGEVGQEQAQKGQDIKKHEQPEIVDQQHSLPSKQVTNQPPNEVQQIQQIQQQLDNNQQ